MALEMRTGACPGRARFRVQLRVHLLRGMHDRDGPRLPQLRRRVVEEAEADAQAVVRLAGGRAAGGGIRRRSG